MDIAIQKRDLRRSMQNMRDALPVEDRQKQSQFLGQKVIDAIGHLGISKVHCYVSFGSEVETHQLLGAMLSLPSLQVWVPKVRAGGQLSHHRLRQLTELQRGAYGILESTQPEAADWHGVELVLVPGLAFTTCGNRLGYGKGFYDRFLARLPRAKVWGLAYDDQVLDHLPLEGHDLACDEIWTPKGRWRGGDFQPFSSP